MKHEGRDLMTQQDVTADPWDIVAYEARMLFDLCRLINGGGFKSKPQLERNAIVESTCLHMRILIDVLLSKDSGKGDDIKLSRLLSGFNDASVKALDDAYHHGPSPTPCRELNKMLAHPTLSRGTEHDYTALIRKLLPHVEAVWTAVEKHPARITTQRSETTGEIDPNFCAKTSS
jgi:hypothetical protein